MIGQTLEGNGVTYTFKKKVGTGGYAVAYRVTSSKDGKDYVLKKINMEFLSEEDAQNAFKEINAFFKLRCDYVIQIHGFFQNDQILLGINKGTTSATMEGNSRDPNMTAPDHTAKGALVIVLFIIIMFSIAILVYLR